MGIKAKIWHLSEAHFLNRGLSFSMAGATILILFIVFQACSPFRMMRLSSVGAILEDVARASGKMTEVEIVKEGFPAYILLMEGLLEEAPQNRQLLLAASQAYSSYASAFVEKDDPERARGLFLKARDYALKALLHRKDFQKNLFKTFDEFTGSLEEIEKEDVPALFFAASAWGSWIGLMGESVAPMADLPKVVAMVEKVLDLDEGFYYGGAHLFMGVYYSARPPLYGGDFERAKGHFEKAFKMGEGKFLMAYVLYAKYYAKGTLDKGLFQSSLTKVLESRAVAVPELTLHNTIAKRQARDLLSRIDEFF